MKKIFTIGGICLSLILAKASTFDELTALSFDDLLNVRVSVATKFGQSIHTAPGIITVYTSDDLERFGYTTLEELGNITAGYSSNIRFGESGFETRGQGFDGWNNNKHLLLIDGIPIRHIRANRMMIEENMPIHGADQIEFLKGPASALYGIGAFYGVVNVSFPDVDTTTGSIRLFSGNKYSTKGALATLSASSNYGNTLSRSAYFTKQPSRKPIMGNESRGYEDRNQSIFLHSRHLFNSGITDGVSIGFLYSEKTGGIGEFWGPTTHHLNKVNWTTFTPYAKYERVLPNNLLISSYIAYTESSERGLRANNHQNTTPPLQIVGEWEEKLRSLDINCEVHIPISWGDRIVAGVNYYSNRGLGIDDGSRHWFVELDSSSNLIWGGDNTFFVEKDPTQTYSAFLQYTGTFPILEGLHITAGLREDYGTYRSHSFNQLSPRLALVQSINPRLNLKALLGTALRAPGQKEFSLNDEAMRRIELEGADINIAELNAENIISVEGGLTYNRSRFVASASVFRSVTKNTIENFSPYKTSEGMNINIFRNSSDDITAYGTELDIQALLPGNIRFFANYAWARAENSEGERIFGAPINKVNSGLSYKTGGIFPTNISLINKYTQNYVISNTESHDGNNIFDILLSTELTKNLSLDIQGKNISNDKTEALSGAVGVNSYYVPSQPRIFYFGVTAKF